MASTLPPSVPATHPAVAILAPRQPLALIDRPTIPPREDEALVRVTWTAASPLDLHRADGGLLLPADGSPLVMGSTLGGTVVALGPPSAKYAAPHLHVGDTVFGFVMESNPPESAGHQAYATVPVWRLSRLPTGVALPDAVTVPTNLVTAFHTLTEDLGLALPWPVPPPDGGWVPREADDVVLVWGAASSVGMYVVQVLRHWGYRHVVAVASAKHHAGLRALGAAECFDYRSGDAVEQVLRYVDVVAKGKGGAGPRVPFIVDCIGSVEGTLKPLTRIAERGTKVAVMLPIIKVHASEDRAPEFEMDVSKVLPGEWNEGVELKGTRTHFYAKNEFFKDHLQPEIVPALLEQGAISPNKKRIVEGDTMLERAENALRLLRNQAPSGEKLVWKVADDDD